MKYSILTTFLISALILMSCDNSNKNEIKKSDKFYLLSSRTCDTVYIDKPNFDTTGLTVVQNQKFNDFCSPSKSFSGLVIKMNNRPAPTDGEVEYYFTPDLGIIYSKSTTWLNYTRLHSTNDSIENRINEYIDHILTRTDLIISGEIRLIQRSN